MLLLLRGSFRSSGHRGDGRDRRSWRQHSGCRTVPSRHLDKRDDPAGRVSDKCGRNHLSVRQHDVEAAEVVVLAFVGLERVVNVLLLLVVMKLLLLLQQTSTKAGVSSADGLVSVILPGVGRVGSVGPLILVERIERVGVKLPAGGGLAELVITFGRGGSVGAAQGSRRSSGRHCGPSRRRGRVVGGVQVVRRRRWSLIAFLRPLAVPLCRRC